MPTLTYSRRSRYWRPICTNKLNVEPVAAGTVEPVARPCYACVYPIEVPPKQGCWCNTTTRPGGVDSALILTLGGSFGADSAGGTFLSNSGSVTRTTNAALVIPSMSPADGQKSSTFINECSRQWTSATGTTFVAKNLNKYLPQQQIAPGGGGLVFDPCTWYSLAGMKYYERVYHSTIVRTVPRSTYTYNEGFGLMTGSFHGVTKVKDHEIRTREVTLNNNDPSDIWIAATFVDPRFTPALFVQYVKAWVPSIANGMPFEAGGTPCAPVACNQSCYPVSGFCHYSDGVLHQTDGIVRTRYAFWQWFPEFYGYYWIIRRFSAGVWLAWLIGRSSVQFSTATHIRPLCHVSGGALSPYNAYYSASSSSGYKYPLSYHNSQPTWVQPGGFVFGAGGSLTGGGNLSFGGGMTGTARHPSWSGSVPTLNIGTMAPVSPFIGQQNTPLAVYATTDLPCNHSGVAPMLKIADYRTAPNAATQPIYAGPTSFPSTATLQF